MGIGNFAKQSQEVLWNQQKFFTEAKSQPKATWKGRQAGEESK